ncbi:DUF3592 domain-containing protein [Nocardioides lijunqiniae]|uniref:DUF3592 domain-containing protein n=1 Tax=Nocardioides lijunqiniae TaxID=2760832 RepID=UPI0018778605|nr:DUF3592 domain-containing protein [Nocardioides lijunqiniae]
MWGKVGFCGVLLLAAGYAGAQANSDDRLDSLESLRDGSGVRVEATVTGTHEVERRQKSGRRTYTTRTVTCPVYTYADEAGVEREHRERYACKDVSVGDTSPLIYDPDAAAEVYLDTDATTDRLQGSARMPFWFTTAGVVVLVLSVVGAVLGFVGRRRARAAPTSG